MLRCCYVTGQGLGGGWDINIHVPCVHTWMLRCCYVTGQGLGGVGWDINVHLPCVHNLLHEACNHSKGIFCITKKKKCGNLLVDTGGIDGMWKFSKGAVSSSWSTRKDGAVNLQLLQGIRIWQWRWHHGNSTDFLSLTGRALSKRLEKWQASEEQGKGFHPATTTKPCKYHDIPSKSFNFDRQNLR